MRRAIAAAGSIGSALGIFFRFQIPDFDFFLGFFGFFSLCHFQFSSFLWFRLVTLKSSKIVLGRNSRLSYLPGCGERYFFDQKSGDNIKAALRGSTVMRFLVLNPPIYAVVSSLGAAE
jgi:hypothetical protein